MIFSPTFFCAISMVLISLCSKSWILLFKANCQDDDSELNILFCIFSSAFINELARVFVSI